jgi:hypothetical protein
MITDTTTNQKRIELRTIDKTVDELVGNEHEYGLIYESDFYSPKGDYDDLQKVLNTLMPREKDVLIGRFLKGQTLKEVGLQIKTSIERVRQIEARALRKLRHPERINKLRDLAGLLGFEDEDEQSTIERQREKIEEDCKAWKKRVEERAKMREEFEKLLSVESPISHKLLFPELYQNA